MEIRKRQINADTGVPHISTKDWADSTEAQISIEAQIDKLDVDEVIKTHLRTKLNFDELPADEAEAMDALRNIAESVNSEIDKFNAGQILSTTKGGSKFVDPQTLADQTKEVSEDLERRKAEIEAEEDEERRKKLQEEYDKKKAERDQLYEDMSGAVSTVSTSMLETGKKLVSGDGQQAVDAFLSILIGVGAFLTKGIMAAVHGIKSYNEARKLGKDLSKQEKGLRDAQALVDEIAAGNHDAGMEPVTAEEAQEITNAAAQEEFEEVGEIETWDDAFKYGFAKLKQIHGLKYDEAKARETLEGLKESYPDNPKVVIGALKYGGGHRKEDEQQNNSRDMSKTIDLRRKLNSNRTPGQSLRTVFGSISEELGITDLSWWMNDDGVGFTYRNHKFSCAFGLYTNQAVLVDYGPDPKSPTPGIRCGMIFNIWDEIPGSGWRIRDFEIKECLDTLYTAVKYRKKNARPQLRKVYREFGDAAEAYNWIMDASPMEDPIATIRIDGKVADLKWDSNGEQLVLESINLPTRVELFDDSDWIRKNALGDMFDRINQQIREYGE